MGVEALELGAGIGNREAPGNCGVVIVSSLLPGVYGSLESFDCWTALSQAGAREYRQFNLSHVQPTAMDGREVESQLARDAPCFGSWKGVVERTKGVGIEVVQHHVDHACLRVAFVNEVLHAAGEVELGTLSTDLDVPAAGQWLDGQQQAGRATPDVLVVLPGWLTGCRRQRWVDVAQQLRRALVETNDRLGRIVGCLLYTSRCV